MAELEELSGAKISDLHRERSVAERLILFRSVIQRASIQPLEQNTESRVEIKYWSLNFSVDDSCRVEERWRLSLSWMWGAWHKPPGLSSPDTSEGL